MRKEKDGFPVRTVATVASLRRFLSTKTKSSHPADQVREISLDRVRQYAVKASLLQSGDLLIEKPGDLFQEQGDLFL